MPYIHVCTSAPVDQDQEQRLKQQLGEDIALIPGKSEEYLMVRVEDQCRMYFKGKNDRPVTFVTIAILGKAGASPYAKVTQAVTEHISAILKVPADQLYIQYQEADFWALNGKNF